MSFVLSSFFFLARLFSETLGFLPSIRQTKRKRNPLFFLFQQEKSLSHTLKFDIIYYVYINVFVPKKQISSHVFFFFFFFFFFFSLSFLMLRKKQKVKVEKKRFNEVYLSQGHVCTHTHTLSLSRLVYVQSN